VLRSAPTARNRKYRCRRCGGGTPANGFFNARTSEYSRRCLCQEVSDLGEPPTCAGAPSPLNMPWLDHLVSMINQKANADPVELWRVRKGKRESRYVTHGALPRLPACPRADPAPGRSQRTRTPGSCAHTSLNRQDRGTTVARSNHPSPPVPQRPAMRPAPLAAACRSVSRRR
jgi:hypothetical protein